MAGQAERLNDGGDRLYRQSRRRASVHEETGAGADPTACV
ncbi:MAG: hypothetical protein JWQ46_1906 [Phenylobacterium sp.]|nr:hypothetical protein [Phenylobacterium sp.]